MLRVLISVVLVLSLSACSGGKPLFVKNDVPGLSTRLIDDTLKYVFYKDMVRGEFAEHFRYSYLERIEIVNHSFIKAYFYVHANCGAYQSAWLQKYTSLDSLDFIQRQNCNAMQLAIATFVDANQDWENAQLEGINILTSDNLSNNPRLYVNCNSCRISDLSLSEVASLPTQQPFSESMDSNPQVMDISPAEHEQNDWLGNIRASIEDGVGGISDAIWGSDELDSDRAANVLRRFTETDADFLNYQSASSFGRMIGIVMIAENKAEASFTLKNNCAQVLGECLLEVNGKALFYRTTDGKWFLERVVYEPENGFTVMSSWSKQLDWPVD